MAAPHELFDHKGAGCGHGQGRLSSDDRSPNGLDGGDSSERRNPVPTCARSANDPWQPPGLPLSLVLALSGIGVIGGIALFFPWQVSHAFVSEGWPCAALEVMIAIPATVIFWLLARRGALFASAGLGAVLTGLAVFLALVPLQVQCMFLQAPHLVVWHAGTTAVLIG